MGEVWRQVEHFHGLPVTCTASAAFPAEHAWPTRLLSACTREWTSQISEILAFRSTAAQYTCKLDLMTKTDPIQSSACWGQWGCCRIRFAIEPDHSSDVPMIRYHLLGQGLAATGVKLNRLEHSLVD